MNDQSKWIFSQLNSRGFGKSRTIHTSFSLVRYMLAGEQSEATSIYLHLFIIVQYVHTSLWGVYISYCDQNYKVIFIHMKTVYIHIKGQLYTSLEPWYLL